MKSIERAVSVSVIIPLYNKERYIAETLESLRQQSFGNWEALVVDDGSTDRSVEVVKEFIRKENRVRLFHREGKRRGGSVCRNIGLREARGEFVIFLDADDLLLPHALAQRVACISGEDEVDFVVYPVGHFIRRIGDTSLVKRIDPAVDHTVEFLAYRIPWHTTSPIWRIGFLERLGGFDEAYPRLQDVELHTRALLAEGRYRVEERIDFYHRLDEERRQVTPEKKADIMVESFLHYLAGMDRKIAQCRRRDDPALKRALKAGMNKLVGKVVYEPISLGKKVALLRRIGRSEAYRRIADESRYRRQLRRHALFAYLHYVKQRLSGRR